uniref:EGF-like domain-containing protein n=1 Tax=Ciona savignyi TaxID=51511 RepID=H2Z7M6_CIOSA
MCTEMCHQEASCLSTGGPRGTCTCRDGYEGDGVNLCRRAPSCPLTCVANAHCIKQEVTDLPPYTCVCNRGYRGIPQSMCFKWPHDNADIAG